MSRYTPGWKKVLQLPRKTALRLRERGLGDAAAWCWYQFAWRWREWRLGIDTREFAHGVVVDDQGVCHGYEPIDYRSFDIILEWLGDATDEVFVDYGCGMGRAVVLAATRPIRRVIGVEIDERLSEIARQQVRSANVRGHLRCPDVQIITADASTWPLPADATCVFLFNSFTGALLASVLGQIRASLERDFRPLKLVYVQPVIDRDSLADCPWLKLRDILPTGFWTHVRTVVYEPDPEAFEHSLPKPTALPSGRRRVAGLENPIDSVY